MRKPEVMKLIRNQILSEYTRTDAERTFPSEATMFPKKEKDESHQTYGLSDIKNHLIAKTSLEACRYASKGGPECDETNQEVDKKRASIQKECEEVTSNIEIEHGWIC